ncbi:MAG TPA: IPT/TIG domain-containing protein [Jatrophihabitans sp.]|jgi:hypothetical protein
MVLRRTVVAAAVLATAIVAVAVPASASQAVSPRKTVINATPLNGPRVGGTTVTVTGHGFTKQSRVYFGLTLATKFHVLSSTKIVVQTPTVHSEGGVKVSVRVNGKVQSTGRPPVFVYHSPPHVNPIDNDMFPYTTGGTLRLAGSDFTGKMAVTIDGVKAAIVGSTTRSITVTVPPHPLELDAVVVVSSTYGSATTHINYFDPDPTDNPAISSRTPSFGPDTGGTLLTLTGTGFTGTTAVYFDRVADTNFTVVNDSTITVITPPHAVGAVYIGVGTPRGGSAQIVSFGYVLNPTTPSTPPVW